MVPGASDDLINARKKAPKATVKHVTELPVEPNYEYDLPVASTKEKQGGDKPSAEELKVRRGCTAAMAGIATLLRRQGCRSV